jgi:ubiquitin carboxyl-terminal hydrolase 14
MNTNTLALSSHIIGLWKGVLKDDLDFSSLDFVAALAKTKGAPLQILLMGSATKLVAPKIKTVFLEDLPPEEVAKVQEPSGLVNMGNTCYLNSVVQCLRAVDPFRKGLSDYQGSGGQNTLFLTALKDLYGHLDRTADPVPPSNFLRLTKMAFPQFNQLGPQGQPMQQDAEEFYSGLLTQAASVSTDALQATNDELQGATNLADAVFGIAMEETMRCDESSDEVPVVTQDLHRKLVCNIQGGTAGQNVGHIAEGIQLGLEGKIEKNSQVLGRNAMWTRRQRMARLPPILVVQFGRFYWKATPDSQDHAGVKCKIMKKVSFSSTLDVYEFCSEKVQTILKGCRDKALAEEEERIQKKLDGKENENDDDVEMKQDEDEEMKAALAMSMESAPVGPGLPANFQGQYELFAVVTHKGRSADGGHYMGWVKAASHKVDKEDLDEDWFVFNDDEVSPCKTEDILKLQGGGDYDMSYLNFYRAKK